MVRPAVLLSAITKKQGGIYSAVIYGLTSSFWRACWPEINRGETVRTNIFCFEIGTSIFLLKACRHPSIEPNVF